MLEQLLQYNNIGLFILRIAVGIIFLYHGLPKLTNTKGLAKAVGMPAGVIFILGVAELLAVIGLVLGLYLQWAALVLALIMIGSSVTKMMKWNISFSAENTTGWEFDFILFAANVALFLGGGGSIGL